MLHYSILREMQIQQTRRHIEGTLRAALCGFAFAFAGQCLSVSKSAAPSVTDGPGWLSNFSRSGNAMEDYLTFRKMITPTVIQILFWLGVAACVLVALVTMVTSLAGAIRLRSAGPLAVFVFGVIYLVVGPVLVRVWCELVVVFFRMNDTLTQIKANTDRLQQS